MPESESQPGSDRRGQSLPDNGFAPVADSAGPVPDARPDLPKDGQVDIVERARELA